MSSNVLPVSRLNALFMASTLVKPVCFAMDSTSSSVPVSLSLTMLTLNLVR